jgi:hypothetical protein
VIGGPDFLLIGAAKSGTTALYRALRDHPQIFMPHNKEPHFFAFPAGPLSVGGPRDRERHGRTITDQEAYETLFAARRPDQIAGEASTYHLCSPIAATRIRDALPRVRLLAILREPAARAFANYLHLVRQGFETAATFEEALDLEPARIAAGWDFFWRYRDLGYYHRQLARYYDLFERDRIKVMLYDDFQRDPAGVVRGIFSFLGVDESFTPELSRRFNRSGIPRSRRVQTWLAAPPRGIRALARRWLTSDQRLMVAEAIGGLNLRRPAPEPAAMQDLRRGYRGDLEALERLTGIDLSIWLRQERESVPR